MGLQVLLVWLAAAPYLVVLTCLEKQIVSDIGQHFPDHQWAYWPTLWSLDEDRPSVWHPLPPGVSIPALCRLL